MEGIEDLTPTNIYESYSTTARLETITEKDEAAEDVRKVNRRTSIQKVKTEVP
jgi:hypothetical protein